MHEPQRAQFADLPLVDRRLKGEIELIERLHVRQVSQLQPGLQITLPPRIGFGAHHFEQKVAVGRFLLRGAFQQRFQPRVDGRQAQRRERGSQSFERGVIAHLPPGSRRPPAAGAPPPAHPAECESASCPAAYCRAECPRDARADGDHLMPSDCRHMHGDPLGAVAHFDIVPVIAHPDLFARIVPRHRVSAAPPGDVRVARHFALLIIHIGIGRAPVENRLHGELIFVPAHQHLLVRRAVNALVGHLR